MACCGVVAGVWFVRCFCGAVDVVCVVAVIDVAVFVAVCEVVCVGHVHLVWYCFSVIFPHVL